MTCIKARAETKKPARAGFFKAWGLADSANCRICHAFTPEVLARQKEFAQKMHAGRKAENKTCIDCHTGIAHEAPAE